MEMSRDDLRVLLITNGNRADKVDAVKNSKLIKILHRFTMDTTLITFASTEETLDIPREKITELRNPKSGVVRVLYTQIASLLEILRIRSKGRIDRVVFAFGMDLQLLPVIASKVVAEKTIIRSDGRPSLVYERYFTGHTRLQGMLFKLVEGIDYRLANFVITECRYMIKDNKLERYHTGVGNLFIDFTVFHPLIPIDDREFDLGYIGRLSPEKGIQNFLEALDRLPKELRVIVIGDGNLRDSVHRRISDLNKLCAAGKPRIEFHPWMRHEELPETLNEIKLLVIPSLKEGLPNIMIEAMACGTPVLATPVGGIPGVIEHKETGFVIKDNSSTSIADGILDAFSGDQLERISANAHQDAMKEFSLESTINKWREVF